MIKTPVYFENHEIRDAKGRKVCTPWNNDIADQIVAALNVQQPKCEACGGTGKVKLFCRPLDELEAGIEEFGPCPDCQSAPQTADKPVEGWVKKLRKAVSVLKACSTYEGDITVVPLTFESAEEIASRIEELEKTLRDALEAMDKPAVQATGDWQTGMFCGLEDKNITDRYEACIYGYEQALEKVQEWVLCDFEAALGGGKE